MARQLTSAAACLAMALLAIEGQAAAPSTPAHVPASVPARAGPAAPAPVASALASTRTTTATSPAHHPLEGRWLAHAGPPDNQATLGLEFTRDADGDWMAYATTDLANAWRQPAGPVAQGDQDGEFTLAGGQVKLTLAGDRTLHATGFLHDPAESVTLQHVATIPAAPRAVAWPKPPAPAWAVRTGGAIFAPVAVDDDTAYVGNVDGVFAARRLADGAVRWTFAPGHAFLGEALVDGDGVLVACDDGFLYRLDKATGKVQWRHDLGDGAVARVLPDPAVSDYDTMAPRPLRAGDLVIIGSRDGSVHAVKAADGELAWRVALEDAGAVRTSAVALDADVVVTTKRGAVVRLAQKDGALAWRFDAQAEIASPPALVAGRVIVGTRDSRLLALDAATGQPAWSQYWWGAWVESAAVARGPLAYIGSGDLQRVSAIDAATGHNVWRTEVGGWVMQRPAVGESTIVVGVSGAHRNGTFWATQQGGVVALDRATGKMKWGFALPDAGSLFLHGAYAAPVMAKGAGGKGLVVVGGLDGALYAWPTE